MSFRNFVKEEVTVDSNSPDVRMNRKFILSVATFLSTFPTTITRKLLIEKFIEFFNGLGLSYFNPTTFKQVAMKSQRDKTE